MIIEIGLNSKYLYMANPTKKRCSVRLNKKKECFIEPGTFKFIEFYGNSGWEFLLGTEVEYTKGLKIELG